MTTVRCLAARLPVLGLLLATLLVVGCSEGGSDPAATPETPAATPSESSTPAPAATETSAADDADETDDNGGTAPADDADDASAAAPAATNPPDVIPATPIIDPVNGPDEYPPLTAVIDTDKGVMKIKLYPNIGPQEVIAHFVNLVQRGYYDGLTWHYVMPGFKISTGDPAEGAVGGDLGYRVNHEFTRLTHESEYPVSMSAVQLNQIDSMFFISMSPLSGADLKYAMFGNVIEGQDVVHQVQQGDRIRSITIEGETKWLLQDWAPEIRAWNAVLDRTQRQR